MRFVPFAAALAIAIALAFASTSAAPPPAPLKLLFLGDDGHHQPAARFRQLAPVMRARNIDLAYTNDANNLNPQTLRDFDGIVLYANIDRIEDDQARALLDFVAAGKGFVPLHCASYCFRNNDQVVALIGGQFLRHGTGTFRTTIVRTDHPVMKGFQGFESWDETYVHTLHNEQDRTVLRRGRKAAPKSRGRGSARMAKAACSIPPGDTTSAPGRTPVSKTLSSGASAGRAGAIPPWQGRFAIGPR